MSWMKPFLAAALALALPAAAAPEPAGPDLGNWRFTQESEGRVTVCRALHSPPGSGFLFPLRIARRSDGRFTIEVPGTNVPRGRYEGADFAVGRDAEPVNVSSDGAYLLIPVDDDMLGRVARANGFRWALRGRGQGNVAIENGAGVANRLRTCTRANGGR